MKRIESLEQEADRRGRVFVAQINATTERLKPLPLVNAVLAQFDSDLQKLERMRSQTQRNPFPLLAAVAGILMVFRQFNQPSETPIPASDFPKPARRFRRLATKTKGEHHGQYSNTK
jgi:hypothetical protein